MKQASYVLAKITGNTQEIAVHFIETVINTLARSSITCQIISIVVFHQWPLSLTWFKFNPSMDK